jgi:hypothetical protein
VGIMKKRGKNEKAEKKVKNSEKRGAIYQ